VALRKLLLPAALSAVAALLAGCSAGSPPLRAEGAGVCTPAPQAGKPVLMGLWLLDNQGTTPVTVRGVSLPDAHGMAMTQAWVEPLSTTGPQIGVGLAYPPVTYPLWAHRVPAAGAVIPPGQDRQLVFGVLRTTAADGSSAAPLIVYTASHSSYTLRMEGSMAVAATRCAPVS
jgi:hypothetical protein